MSKYEVSEHRDVSSHLQLPDGETEELERCIANAFGERITPEDARSHMMGKQVLVARFLSDEFPPEVVGFSATSIDVPSEQFQLDELSSEPGIYFAGAAITQKHQGTGLYGTLNESRLQLAFENDIDHIYTRTQNPRVEEGITSSLERLVEQHKIRAFKLGRVIMRGAYGKMLTAEKPTAREISYDDFNYEKGDAAVITWQLER